MKTALHLTALILGFVAEYYLVISTAVNSGVI